ncbi:MAG: hypothetical protein IAG13_29900 [Deltaproteobacteria bacterium]|nr:hypothetical protein [Nannocystaceae bacterium]
MLDRMRWSWPVLYGVGIGGTWASIVHADEPLTVGPAIEVAPPPAGAVLVGTQHWPRIASTGSSALTVWTQSRGANQYDVVAMPLDAQCVPELDHLADLGVTGGFTLKAMVDWDGEQFAVLVYDRDGKDPAQLLRVDEVGQRLGDAVPLATARYDDLACNDGVCLAVSSTVDALVLERIDSGGDVQPLASLPEPVDAGTAELAWIGDAFVMLWPRVQDDDTLALMAWRFSTAGEPQGDAPTPIITGLTPDPSISPVAVAGGPSWLVHHDDRLWNMDGLAVIGNEVPITAFDTGTWLGTRYLLVGLGYDASLYTPGASAAEEVIDASQPGASDVGEIASVGDGACLRLDTRVAAYTDDDGFTGWRAPALAHQSQFSPTAAHAESAGLVAWGGPDELGESAPDAMVIVDAVGLPTSAARPFGSEVRQESGLVSSRSSHARIQQLGEAAAIEILAVDGSVTAQIGVPVLPRLAGRAHRFMAAWYEQDRLQVQALDPAGVPLAEQYSHQVYPAEPQQVIAAGDGFALLVRLGAELFEEPEYDRCGLVFLDADGRLAAESETFEPCPWSYTAELLSDGAQLLVFEDAHSGLEVTRFELDGTPIGDGPTTVLELDSTRLRDVAWTGEHGVLALHREFNEISEVGLVRIDGEGQLLDDEPVWFADAERPDLSGDGRMLVYESRAADRFAPRVVLHMLGDDEPGGDDSTTGADTGDESGAATTTTAALPDTSGEAGGGDGSGTVNDGCGCRGSDGTAPWWLIFVLPLVRRRAASCPAVVALGPSSQQLTRVSPHHVKGRAF